MDPTENLNKIQQDILGLSAKLHQMTEDNSSWFGNLLGKPWLWIKEIAILLLFLLLAYYLCVTVVIPNVASTHPSQTLNGRRTQYSGCLFFLLFSAAILIVSEEYIKMYY